MISVPTPPNEKKRLNALLKFGLLDSPAEGKYDELVQLASAVCKTPVSLLTLIDADRQWFKAKVGVSIDESHRDISFCSYAILGEELMEVPDTLQDERFRFNPLVVGEPHVRFYAGMPLVTSDGFALGTLCVLDTQPRVLSSEQRFALQVLARQVINQVESEYSSRQLREVQRQLGKRHSKILDSIRYGDLIHRKLMPRRRLMQEHFQESFILWKPRDIIANNFCFLKEDGENLFVAVVDCMDQCFINPFFGTLINDYLQQIIGQGTSCTAEILQELHKRLSRLWPHNSQLAMSGISMGLCRLDKKRQTLSFSGADQLLFTVSSSGGLRSFRGNKVRLGKEKLEEASSRYVERSMDIKNDTAFYLLSKDMQELLTLQGKKDIREALKKSLLLQESPMEEQSSVLLQYLREKSKEAQQKEYDVLVVGFKGAQE